MFLSGLIDKGKAFSTIKVYLAAISARHVGFGDKSVGRHPLVSRLMKGARRKLPVSRPLVPLWDLSVVLEAISQHPFEPLEEVGLKFASLKTAFLLTLTTEKHVSDLQALSIRPPACNLLLVSLKSVCSLIQLLCQKWWRLLIGALKWNWWLFTLLLSHQGRNRDSTLCAQCVHCMCI